MGILTKRASDIILSNQQLCEAMGYLAREGRMRIEAQVPYGKEEVFRNAYPDQCYDKMLATSDKHSFQLRIIMKNIANCPAFLKTEISAGGGSNTPGCISRGLFVERIVGEYGFKFGVETQNVHDIRCNVQQRFPNCIQYFDKGYNTPL